jgi:hypothetical protein
MGIQLPAANNGVHPRMNSTTTFALLEKADTVAPAPSGKVHELLELARSLQLYGAYPELKNHVRHGSYNEALQLVRRLRLEDNRPLHHNPRIEKLLRLNDSMLLQLELLIVQLLAN